MTIPNSSSAATTSNPNISTGYGPSAAPSYRRLFFNGDADNYELWEVKFLGHMRLQKLSKVFGASETDVNDDENANAYAELIQLIDDRSLSQGWQFYPGGGKNRWFFPVFSVPDKTGFIHQLDKTGKNL